jgi:hypothetical protein
MIKENLVPEHALTYIISAEMVIEKKTGARSFPAFRQSKKTIRSLNRRHRLS